MKEALVTDKAPAALGPYSAGVKNGDLVFVSGQLPIDPSSGQVVEGVKAQTQQCFTNIANILKEADMDLSHVVKAVVFLTDMGDFKAVNEVYAEQFEAPFPARSAFQVAALPNPQAKLEIEVIAMK